MHDLADLPLHEPHRTADGVLVERRSFFAMATLAIAAADPRRAPDLCRLAGTEEITLEEFLARAVPIARDLVAAEDRLGQDRYLFTIASLAVAIADPPPPAFRPSGQGDGAFIGVHDGGDPFTMLHWKLEPGGFVRPHPHTYGNVVTVGLAGSARVRNYELEDLADLDRDDGAAFPVVRTKDQLLRPRAINTVSLERDSIHAFEAGPDGARGFDITTRIRDRRPTRYLEIDESAGGDGPRFTAHWR